MKKPSTRTVRRRGKLPDGQPTIGLDLGDQSSFYCVLNGTGEVILEERITQMTTCGSLSPVPWGISQTILWQSRPFSP
jgi:hypothetical protein